MALRGNCTLAGKAVDNWIPTWSIRLNLTNEVSESTDLVLVEVERCRILSDLARQPLGWKNTGKEEGEGGRFYWWKKKAAGLEIYSIICFDTILWNSQLTIVGRYQLHIGLQSGYWVDQQFCPPNKLID